MEYEKLSNDLARVDSSGNIEAAGDIYMDGRFYSRQDIMPIVVKSPNMDRTIVPESSYQYWPLVIQDKNGAAIGYIKYYQTSEGKLYISMAAVDRYDNDTNRLCGIDVGFSNAGGTTEIRRTELDPPEYDYGQTIPTINAVKQIITEQAGVGSRYYINFNDKYMPITLTSNTKTYTTTEVLYYQGEAGGDGPGYYTITIENNTYTNANSNIKGFLPIGTVFTSTITNKLSTSPIFYKPIYF